MTSKQYHQLTNVWSQRLLTLHFLAWSTFFIYHFKVTHELTFVKMIFAEIGMLSWSVHDSISLIQIRYTLRKMGYDTGDQIIESVISNRAVEVLIYRVLVIASIMFFAAFNIVFLLRELSILIPAMYYMFVSIVVALSSPLTNRVLFRRAINAALEKPLSIQDHRATGKSR